MTSTNSSKTQHAYIQFTASVRRTIDGLGLPTPTLDPSTPTGLPENDGYVFVEWGQHLVAPAIIIPKSKLRMGNLHSHLDLSAYPGHVPLPKKNGRVVCHFEADLAKVSRVLALFADATASKRPVAPPVKRQANASQPASQAPVSSTPVIDPIAQWMDAQPVTAASTDLADHHTAGYQPTTDYSYSDDEADEALQALGQL